MTHTISDMRSTSRSVAVAATDGMLHFEMALAAEVFGSAPDALPGPWYDVKVCATRPVRVGRFLLEPDRGLDWLARAGTVIVPALADVEREPPTDLVEAVRAAHASGARVVSLCTGVFVLAAAGLLDGLRATTHWAHTEELAARFPPGWRSIPTCCTSTTAACSPPRARPRRWTCACTWSAATTARRSPTSSPAAWSCHPTVLGGQAQFVSTPVPCSGRPSPGRTAHLGDATAGPAAHRGGSGPPGQHELAPPGPALPPDHRDHSRCSGCTRSGSAALRSCWRPPTTASTPSPRLRAWARRRPCAATSTARSAYRRTSLPPHVPRMRDRPMDWTWQTLDFTSGQPAQDAARTLETLLGVALVEQHHPQGGVVSISADPSVENVPVSDDAVIDTLTLGGLHSHAAWPARPGPLGALRQKGCRAKGPGSPSRAGRRPVPASFGRGPFADGAALPL